MRCPGPEANKILLPLARHLKESARTLESVNEADSQPISQPVR